MKKAFTLIELLVVIAIIAILAAILFPVFAQAKQAAKKSVDLSNQKQIGLAMLMYANDSDDDFPRDDYRLPTRQTWAPITFRELTAPYVKNGVENVSWVMLDSSTTGPVADGGIWESPGQPTGSRYGYGVNGAILPSSQLWSFDAAGAPDDKYNDQQGDGTPTGNAPVPSVSQTQLPHPASTLLMTTMGIVLPWNTANTYMQPAVYWWAGGGLNIHGATPPSQWDADSSQIPTYDGSLPGPYSSLPRFRYTNSANAVWADGHAKSKTKGSMGWCTDMFVAGSIVDPWSDTQDDSWAFGAGQVCAGYSE